MLEEARQQLAPELFRRGDYEACSIFCPSYEVVCGWIVDHTVGWESDDRRSLSANADATSVESTTKAYLYSLFRKAGTFFKPVAGLLAGLGPDAGSVVNAWLELPASCKLEGSL